MNHTHSTSDAILTAAEVDHFLAEIRELEQCFRDGLITKSELEHAREQVTGGMPTRLGFIRGIRDLPLD